MQKVLTGKSWRVACKGDVSGRAVLINAQSDLEQFEEGDVLIANQTDMNYTPFMLRSTAVITEHGGRYSHAAIFCREHAIPCFVGVAGVMSEIQTGEQIRVDTNNKSITVLNMVTS